MASSFGNGNPSREEKCDATQYDLDKLPDPIFEKALSYGVIDLLKDASAKGVIDGVGPLVSYRLVRLTAVREWSRWKRYQDLDPREYVDYYPVFYTQGQEGFNNPDANTEQQGEGKGETAKGKGGKRKRRLYFISHRWLDPMHPDPEGTQLRRVQRLPPLPLRPTSGDNDSSSHLSIAQPDGHWSGDKDPAADALIFYDFSSMPQPPRTSDQEQTFDFGISGLNSILPLMRVVILVDPDYMSRSWCLMEYFISAFYGSLILDEVQDECMNKLQQFAIAPNQEISTTKSARAEVEAGRGEMMGELARSFFSERFLHSRVTKLTDRLRIEDVFQQFIKENIKAWTYEPYIGWRPKSLQTEEVGRILRGERVPLIELTRANPPMAPRIPGPSSGLGNTTVPHSLPRLSLGPRGSESQNEDGDSNYSESLDRYWAKSVCLRGCKYSMLYYLLNDPSAGRMVDQLKLNL
ncbi:hypothetical protein V502_00862 [Pseudogymnoascus sp. VKM F-4520 (FW-2644)]|nr:hypothetical protein V502_00862 [Pseudogymnoascus sp. VKM F-4520 (FW-2644)]